MQNHTESVLNKKKEINLSKKLYILSAVILFTAVITGSFYGVKVHKKSKIISSVIEAVGGNKTIKKKCLKDMSGPIHMESGEVHERYLTVADIVRTDKICECVVAKLHKEMSKKAIFEFLPTMINMPNNVAEPVIDMLITVSRTTCETELNEWLENQYKSIILE